jgi:hypothetical protein
MSSLTLHIVLLFAVAYSQICGGVSCCCLSRTIISSLLPAHVASSARVDRAMPNVALAPKCPKCAASQASVARSVNSEGLRSGSVLGSNECQCSKAISSATVQLEPRSQSISVRYVVTAASTWDIILSAQRFVFQGHKVPTRFGGTSWQSIACIWKK